MSKKNLKLGIILAALIVLAALYQGPYKNWKADRGSAKNFLADVNIEEIDKITIINQGEESALERQEDTRWKVGGTKDFYVKKTLSDNFVEQLKKAKKSKFELASSNSENKDDFQTGIQGIRVKLFESDDLKQEFVVGKLGSDFISTYISQDNLSETYLVDANLFGAFSIGEWRDTTIFSSNKENIDKLRFQNRSKEFTLEKVDGTWVGTSPYKFEVSEEKINEVLELMSNLVTFKIPEQTFEGTGFEKNELIVQATGGFVDNTLMIGDEDGNGFCYAKRGNSDNIYLISEAQKEKLDKRIEDFK